MEIGECTAATGPHVYLSQKCAPCLVTWRAESNARATCDERSAAGTSLPPDTATTVGAADAARRLRSGSGKIPPAMEKLQRVQDEIEEATDVMRQNIEQVVGRGEHLEVCIHSLIFRL